MRVILESPYSGDVARNTAYGQAAMLDSLNRGEAPFVSHLLYTQCLDDTIPEQRTQGMKAAQQWYSSAERVVVYEDFGLSGGMKAGIALAEYFNLPIEYRRILPHVGN